MDALTLLKADHEAVETKFAKFEALGPRALKSKAVVVAEVIEALSVHTAIEEQVLYPAVRDRLADEGARSWRPSRSTTSSSGHCRSSTEWILIMSGSTPSSAF
jgi:hypothetical protein